VAQLFSLGHESIHTFNMFGTFATSQMSSQAMLAEGVGPFPPSVVLLWLAILAFPFVFIAFVVFLYYAFPSDAQKKGKKEAKHKHDDDVA